MATISLTSLYTLTNAYTLASKQLASNGSTVFMDDPSTADTHLWYLTATDITPYYRLHTKANGDTDPLDVYNDNGINSLSLHFTSSGRHSGQYWRLDTWQDGTFRLSNNYTGIGAHLDTYADTLEPFLGNGDHTGQHWRFSEYREDAGEEISALGSGSSSSTRGGTSVSASTAVSTTASLSSATSNFADPAQGGSSHGPALSIGAIVGVAIGGLIALTLCICAVVYCLRRRPAQPGVGGACGDASAVPPPAYAVQEGKEVMASSVPIGVQGYQYPVELVGSAGQNPVEMPIAR